MKKKRLSGGARRIIKEKEKMVKGNTSILSFINAHTPSILQVLPQPTITNVEDSSSGEKDYVLNNGPLLINPNNSTAVISTNVDENGIMILKVLVSQELKKNSKNEKGNCFNPDWYDIKSRSGFHFKRNWLVFSPKSNKMYCFSCFLFRTLSKHNSNWSDPAEGVNNFRKGLEKIIKHETSSDHTNTVKEYLVLKARLQNDNTIIHNLMRAEKSEKEHNQDIKKSNEILVEPLIELSTFYQVDVEQENLILEYKSFCSIYNQLIAEIKNKKVFDNNMLKFMIENDMISSYPNLSTLYKIYYTLSISSATAERSFSRLKLIKTYLRSTIAEDRLSNLAVLSIERNVAEDMDYNNFIETFAKMKKRRKTF
ncbi:hypothetical protein QTP88_026849 [Uroleucon formosanum]